MSEKNGSFDEALRIIEKEADMLSPYSLRGDDRESLYQAIRVLEAAGKVDKEGGLKFIHACGYPIFPYPKNARQIRALLEALPDKEE